MRIRAGKKTTVIIFMVLVLIASSCAGESYAWNCPSCGRTGNTGNYCGGCAHPAPWIDTKATPMPAPVSAPAPIYTPAQAFTQTLAVSFITVFVTSEAVIRSRPSTDNSVSKILEDHVQIGRSFIAYEKVNSESGGNPWYKIAYNNGFAYVSSTRVEIRDVTGVSVRVGEYVTFGHYPQTAGGKDSTPIEWLVLDVKKDKALLISRYALDCYRYNWNWEDTT